MMFGWCGCWRSQAPSRSLSTTVQQRRGPQARPCRRELARTVPRGVSHSTIEELVDAPGSPFEQLGLAEHQKAGGYDRAARRQVSQLRRLKVDPTALALEQPPAWDQLFSDPSLPLVADLGCGAGRCLLLAAVRQGAVRRGAVRQDPVDVSQQGHTAVRQGGEGEEGQQAQQEQGGRGGEAEECGGEDRGQGQGQGRGGIGKEICGGSPGSVQPGEDGKGAAGRAGLGEGRRDMTDRGDEERVRGRRRGCNYLGVDVRLALTNRANAWSELLGLRGRVAFLAANANASLPQLLGSYAGSYCRGQHPHQEHSSIEGTTSDPSPSLPQLPGSYAGRSYVGGGEGEGGPAEGRPSGRRRDPGDVKRSQGMAAGGEQGALEGGGNGGTVRSGGAGGAGSCGHGTVALVCLQFSDPPYRRQALVSGQEGLVDEIAAALRPGGLVWIQSDVLSIAAALRRLFARHGGFAPSARHAAAASTTVTRHWLRSHGMLAPLAEQRKAAAAAVDSAGRGDGSGAACDAGAAGAAFTEQDAALAEQRNLAVVTIGGARAGAGADAGRSADHHEAAPRLPSQQPSELLADPVTPGAAAAAGAAAGRAGAGSEAGAELQGQGVFPLLVDVDLGHGYQEPWLGPEEVRAAIGRHAARRRQQQEEQQGDGGDEGAGGAGAPAVLGGWGGAGSSTTDRCGGEEGSGDSHSGSSSEDEETQGQRVSKGAGVSTAAAGAEGGDEGGEEGEADPWDGLPWLDANPLGVPTEREVYVERGGRHIYRLLLVRV